ncbi:uncharacterized protein DEA37_0008859 [Paragonimus westermani]|uniref:Uncharacterized protein n=1 Tax=Paragonimus westermani TaxID=34504 RepID=A0A5J4N3X9_9TREM|nr:uncharacterized protein DEA37_0008859 [Paragonimus westermani]
MKNPNASTLLCSLMVFILAYNWTQLLISLWFSVIRGVNLGSLYCFQHITRLEKPLAKP